MIQTKSGPVFTLCFDCAPSDYIPCLNHDQEECDSCGHVSKQVTYSDCLPGQRPQRHPVPRPRVKIPRR